METLQTPPENLAERPEGDRPALHDARPEDFGVLCRGLAKSFRGNWTLRVTRGLEPLDLGVRRGEVFGYLGPNGAGKTTTLKLLTGLLRPTSGRAWLLGVPVEDVASRKRLGFLPEQPYFYDYLTGVEYLEFAGRLSGLGAHPATQVARQWFARVGLGDRERLVLRKYSKGMLQRLGLAAALMHEPELVILDEPMSGLDPFGRRDVRDLLLEQRERGATIVLSSHILPDVEMLCDRVAILLRGKLERVATVGELVSGGQHPVEVRVAGHPILGPAPLAHDVLTRTQRPDETIFKVSDPAQLQAVIAWLVQQRVEIRAVTPQRGSLEALFMAAAEQAAIRAVPSRRSA